MRGPASAATVPRRGYGSYCHGLLADLTRCDADRFTLAVPQIPSVSAREYIGIFSGHGNCGRPRDVAKPKRCRAHVAIAKADCHSRTSCRKRHRHRMIVRCAAGRHLPISRPLPQRHAAVPPRRRQPRPSGENATAVTCPEWPVSWSMMIEMQATVNVSHISNVGSAVGGEAGLRQPASVRPGLKRPGSQTPATVAGLLSPGLCEAGLETTAVAGLCEAGLEKTGVTDPGYRRKARGHRPRLQTILLSLPAAAKPWDDADAK